jgi:hypothetical protein
MKYAALAIGALLLGACANQVHSDRPLFTARDSVGLPKVRPGLWLLDDPDCKVDERTPARTWPKCAQTTTVEDEDLRKLNGLERENRLAGGDPMIFQMGEAGGPFSYTAIAPTRFDDRGRMIAFEMWGVMCGPPPADNRRGLTTRPLPGLTLRGEHCFAARPETVRAAAKPSKDWVEFVLGAHWTPQTPP